MNKNLTKIEKYITNQNILNVKSMPNSTRIIQLIIAEKKDNFWIIVALMRVF